MMILACPRCHASLEDMDAVTKTCMKDRLTFYQVNGIWRMLLPERERYYTRFIRDYETIRRCRGAWFRKRLVLPNLALSQDQ